MREIKIDLINKDGKKITHTQNFIPFKRMIEYWELEEKIENGEIKPGKDVIVNKARFVASLFDDDRVTYEALLDSMDARDFDDYIQKNIYKVMGVEMPNDEEEKEGK